MEELEYSIIAAISENWAIGNKGEIPWHIPEEFKLLKEKTKNSTLIMGKATWESIPEKFRPLPGRINIVLTRDKNYSAPGGIVCNSIENAFNEAKKYDREIFIFGGSKLYEMMLDNATYLYISHVKGEFEADTFFPKFNPENYEIVEEIKSEKFTFRKYKKK